MNPKRIRHTETNEIHLMLSPTIIYGTRSKNIFVFRDADTLEERGIPTNNEFPYGEIEVVEFELLDTDEENASEFFSVVILEVFAKSEIIEMISKLDPN